MIEAALEYAARGWRVLPLRERAKVPCWRDWPQRATTDAEAIHRWWKARPHCNVGIATGDGLAVLDVDPRNGGDDALRLLLGRTRRIETASVHTGGGGRHYYFTAPADQRSGDLVRSARPKRSRFLGLELKAAGRQVVAPPSIHPETRREYAWDPAVPADQLAPLPEWIADKLEAPEPASEPPPLTASVDFLKTIPPPEYFADLAGVKVGAGGGHVRCPAPDHRDRTPSCMVYPNPSGSESGWYCFGCERGGSIYDLAGMLAGQPVPLPRGAVFLRVEDFLIDFYTRKLAV